MSRRVAFPFALGAGGHTACADSAEEIAQRIEQILFVTPGERVNRPDFGSSLSNLTFAARTSELTTAIQALVQGALRKWAGEAVQIRDVKVDVGQEIVAVTVDYVDARTQALRQIRVSR